MVTRRWSVSTWWTACRSSAEWRHIPQRCGLNEDDESTRAALEALRIGPADSDTGILFIRPASKGSRPAEDVERFKRSQYFARIGTWDWRIDSDELYWSDAIYGMFGYQLGQVTPSYQLFCASVHPDDQAQIRAGELRCIETGENHDEEYRVVWPDGTQRWLRETGNVVKDTAGRAVRMMGVVRDITEEKASARELHQLAHHDPLTGLANRLVFEEHLARAIERARRNVTRIALVFIDLNGFKTINDQHGHAAGDQVLVTTGARLRRTLRESDTLARIGGDEFVAILEDFSMTRAVEDEARAIAEKLLAALTKPIQVGDTLHRTGASLGIAVFPDHAPSMDRLIHLADMAMYEAKRSGNNQYRLALQA
ncbi:sensor domain-containing diguanylate cyclase [Pseudomonas lalucatii]|nr:sensor domain-containing diguanylate cyclase [Pseudomonas lalucatii]